MDVLINVSCFAIFIYVTISPMVFSNNSLPEHSFGDKGEKSEDASVAYGFQNIYIDNYMIGVKKYRQFNSEFTTGVTPGTNYFRNYGMIIPQGTAMDYKDSTKVYKNLTVMFQQPPAGGTIGNGIRVWQHGGGSRNPTDGTMQDLVSMITYRGTRVVACNQFIQVVAA